MRLWQPSQRPQNPSDVPTTPTSPTIPASGLLLIRVVEARGISLPPGIRPPQIPPHFSSSTPTSTRGNRDSMQRKQCWWLPYVVLEFDKNEILIDALGGEVQN